MEFSPIFFLSPLLIIVGLGDILIALFVIFKQQRAVNILVALWSVCVGLWSISVALMNVGFSSELIPFGFKAATWVGFFIPLFFLLLSFVFPDKKLNLPSSKLFILSIPSIMYVIFFPTDFWIRVNIVEPTVARIVITPGWIFSYLAYYVVYLIAGIYCFYSNYKKAEGNKRWQFIYLFSGLFLSFLFGILCTVFPVFLGVGNFLPFGPLGTIFFVAFTAFAITKHELMDIRLAISRGVAYGASISVVLLLTLGAIYLNAYIFPNSLVSLFITIFPLALVSAYIFEPIRDFIQTPIDEKWITGWYNSEQLLNNIAKVLGQVSEREEAFKVIAACLKDTIKIKSVGILLGQRNEAPKPDKYVLLKEDITGQGESGEVETMAVQEKAPQELEASRPFIANLSDVVHFDELKAEVKESIEELKFLKGRLYLPLFSTGVLEGIIVLGQKKSEDPYNKKDYALMKSVIIQARAILDRILNYETVKRDFDTNQKKLYDTERYLARSEKIASLALLIREYNHEIRTPLTVIKGKIEGLADEPRSLEYLKELSALMLKHANRIDDIVGTTLRLGGPKERSEVELNLNEVIEGALKIYSPSGVHLIKELGPLPLIKGDRDDLQMVFINLIKNAVEAMPEGGNLKIATYSGSENGEPEVYAEVSDTGVGIPEENREKIFEPFFSTHVTKGRGLGLSIVFRIIREHLGKIEVKSKVGTGSTFKIQLGAMGKKL